MPKPVLQAMVLADHVYRDVATGKHIIAGTFTRILFGQRSGVEQTSPEGEPQRQFSGPLTQVGSPYLYLALTSVHGVVPLELRFVELGDARTVFAAELKVDAADPAAVAEYIIPIPTLPADREGCYSLDLLHDRELLGSWRVSVDRLPDPQSKEHA